MEENDAEAEGAWVSELPEPVRGFLDANIFSASQLEVLLLLRERGAHKARLSEISRVTALPQSSLGPWLDAFVSRGLLEREDDLYWFSPADAGLERLLDEVADTWRRRKTTVTRYIYASTQDPLIRFADAFRLRRSDPSQED